MEAAKVNAVSLKELHALRARTFGAFTEMESAFCTLVGQDLQDSIDAIYEKYGLA